MFKRILVPLDGSRFGAKALRYAAGVASQFSSEVILLQVVKPAVPVAGIAGVDSSAKSVEISVQVAFQEDKRNASRAKRYLREKVRAMSKQNLKASYEVIVGEPGQSILEFARKKHVDLVIMTTHGKSGLKRAIMGSVADLMIRESGIPVLAIHPKHNMRQK